MASAAPGPLQIFISYAHEDEKLCKELLKHLSQMRREGLVSAWYDRELTGGQEWAQNIDLQLNRAHIILLLVSVDFLASAYCNDVEMDRAMERHEARDARVIPIILRPAEWETSRFAKLQALPRNARPIILWRPQDRGFLDAAKGLRRVVEELQLQAEPSPVRRFRIRARRIRMRHWVATLVLIALLSLGWLRWRQANEQVAAGDGFLNAGLYASAADAFRLALSLNPASSRAKQGVAITDVAKLWDGDPTVFHQRVDQMLKEHPHNAYVLMLAGDDLVGLNHLDDAMQRYQQASKLNPDLAEAFFRMGVLYDAQRKLNPALQMFQQAAAKSPYSRHYLNNIADQYFQRGEYDEAIKACDAIPEFPLAAIECARIWRLEGRLEEARRRERLAIDWLEDPRIAGLPENQYPWVEYGAPMLKPEAKLCYALLSLSATSFLNEDSGGAEQLLQRARAVGKARFDDIADVIRKEMDLLGEQRPEWQAGIERYASMLSRH